MLTVSDPALSKSMQKFRVLARGLLTPNTNADKEQQEEEDKQPKGWKRTKKKKKKKAIKKNNTKNTH